MMESGIESLPEQLRKPHKCSICRKVTLSAAGLASDVRSTPEWSWANSCECKPERPESYLCAFCDKVCKFAAGLKRHMILRRDRQVCNIVKTDKFYLCHVCKRGRKIEAGLKNQLWAQS